METKAPITLQDLRRKIYTKAKAEKAWRFWGIYVHICKIETLEEAYKQVKKNKGTPGIDAVSFEEIEAKGLQEFLKQIKTELTEGTYKPEKNRDVKIPKEKGTRKLGIPTIKDRVVQKATQLILEPIFESDFQEGSYGYRPGKRAAKAVEKVAIAIITGKTRVIDIDLKSYFETVRHHILIGKIAKRICDKEVLKLIKYLLKANGKRGLAQGGPLSPLLSNIYLNEVDKMLEKAKETTRKGKYTHVEYARWADDIVILIDAHPKWEWLEQAIKKRLEEELEKLEVTLNREKTKDVNLDRKESFNFLGFTYRKKRTKQGKSWSEITPKAESRKKLLRKLKQVFKGNRSCQIKKLIKEVINPILRGWVNYFRIGNASKCFNYVRNWVEKRVRRRIMRNRKRNGYGWKRWSKKWLYEKLDLYGDYQIRYR